MRSHVVLPCVAVAALSIAACGSSKKSSSSSSAGNPASTGTASTPGKSTPAGRAPSRTYSLKLTGKAEVPPGPPSGSGRAVVSLKGKSNQVCWRFSSLKGATGVTFAHIHSGPAGASGPIVVPLSTGAKLKSKGCVASNAALIKSIAANPKNYYVNIHSKKYPAGAVRSQL